MPSRIRRHSEHSRQHRPRSSRLGCAATPGPDQPDLWPAT